MFEEEEQKDDYNTVLKKFYDYFIHGWNLIHERACFCQQSYLSNTKNCEFDDDRDEHVRKRLVVEIRDKELPQKFQLTTNLLLAKVIQCASPRRLLDKLVSSPTHRSCRC